MPYAALAVVRNRIAVGRPLPFNVRNADRTLLLARGQVVGSGAQLEALLDRGALVDLEELQSDEERLRQLPREALPALWNESLQRVAKVLQHAPHHAFRAALDDAAAPALALIERDPDLAIFSVVRGAGGADVAYGVRRSANCATTAALVAQRLGWEPDAVQRAFKAALTANLSMLSLQGELARQRTPPTPEQLADLQSHPRRSRDMLEAAGVQDTEWLDAVENHHEVEDGSGYPRGSTRVSDCASLVRRADVYTAKLAGRSHREALAADVAGRQMFMQDPGHPMTAALVKEFGIYPPGACVRLAGGETGIVVARGPTVTRPVVVLLTGADGRALPAPERCEAGEGRRAVTGIVGERGIDAHATADRLMALTLR